MVNVCPTFVAIAAVDAFVAVEALPVKLATIPLGTVKTPVEGFIVGIFSAVLGIIPYTAVEPEVILPAAVRLAIIGNSLAVFSL